MLVNCVVEGYLNTLGSDNAIGKFAQKSRSVHECSDNRNWEFWSHLEH